MLSFGKNRTQVSAAAAHQEVAGFVAQHAGTVVGEDAAELVSEELEQARRSAADRQDDQADAADEVGHEEALSRSGLHRQRVAISFVPFRTATLQQNIQSETKTRQLDGQYGCISSGTCMGRLWAAVRLHNAVRLQQLREMMDAWRICRALRCGCCLGAAWM